MERGPQETLKAYGIDYQFTRNGKFTTTCPECGTGYLNVSVSAEFVEWFCFGSCNRGNRVSYEEPKKKTASKLGTLKDTYDYLDENRVRLFQALRFENDEGVKQFRQRIDPNQKTWSIKGVRLVPFMLPELLDDMVDQKTIWIVEGEKDVLTLRKYGIAATCNPMGAGKWRPEFGEYLIGADVVVCGDNDAPGRAHVQDVVRKLRGFAQCIRVLDLRDIWPEIGPSDDISDWIAQGGNPSDLPNLIGNLDPVPDEPTPKPTNGTNGTGEPPPWEPGDYNAGRTPPVKLAIFDKRELYASFVPPDYLVDGMLQRGFCYSATGQTGHAKTALALLIAELVAADSPVDLFLGVHRVERGRVLYFVGENFDDVCMRVIGSDFRRNTENTAIDPMADRITFIRGVFNINELRPQIEAHVAQVGHVDLVIIDTSAAYFLSDDENSNTQIGNHARMLRKLTELPGKPCVLVLCHPLKYVQHPDQLLPRGGGAFLAEVDGNLTVWRTTEMIEVHHNKMRGPGFEPMSFELDTIGDAPRLKDAKGRQLPTVRVKPITDSEAEARKSGSRDDEDRVLAVLLKNLDNDMSYAAMAEQLGWFFGTGEPAKSRVQRAIDRLEKESKPALVKKNRRKIELTDAGREAARKAALKFDRPEIEEDARSLADEVGALS